MITLHDLDTAIAKCQGENSPNANTCIKLAAFYTIRREMFGEDGAGSAPGMPQPGYSTQTAPDAPEQAETYIDFESGSEFSRAINGRDAYAVWKVMDELMDVLDATNPRLYNGVLRKLHEI